MNRSESKYFHTAVKMDRALIELLKKRSLEYITVSELCKTAGVDRSTFYLHYETIMDLLEETARYLVDGFFACFSPTEDQTADFSDRELKDLFFISDKYLTPYLTYVKENKEVFATALKHIDTFGFKGVYKRLYEHIFDPILARFHYPETIRQYVMMYYLNGIHAIILQWLQDDCKKEIKEIADIIMMCIYGYGRKEEPD